MSTFRLRRSASAVLLCALGASVFTAIPASAADDGVVAQGDDWSVTTSPGGYLVTYDLDEPLPMVDDAPTIIVDGVPLGLATESSDGLSLTLTTNDPRVTSARDVETGWSSGADVQDLEGSADDADSAPDTRTLLRQLAPLTAPAAAAADPADTGEYAVTEAEYDFGDRAVALAAIGDIRGEMTGKLYLTSASGERPTIVLLHGRHTSCSGSGSNPLRWPCGPTQMNIRSYLGYEGTARALASHGFNVVSIAANSINSNDNQLALDRGAQARGQLILDTLSWLKNANAGKPVAFDDIAWPVGDAEPVTVTRTLDEALTLATTRTDQPAAPSGVTAASLKGRFDLTNIGIMGHSRGGEGVVSAATLNQGLAKPFGIVSVLPLAPVDFGRMTLPDVPTAVFLPYCDGDVSNQQGQHMIDDSRHAFGDDVLRSAVWVMGADHNFFNTVWTPGLYPAATSDDWRDSNGLPTPSTCHTSSPTRLTAAQQYQVGVSYMTAFFRLTVGGETEFQPLFDGSIKPSTSSTEYADVRIMASQPTSATSLVTSFEQNSSLIRTSGDASAKICTNMNGRTVAQSLPYCTETKGSSQVPHWTPATLATNVPEYPVTRLLWTSAVPTNVSTGQLLIGVPSTMRDVSGRSQLTLKTAPDESVTAGTDFTIEVVDGHNHTFSVAASEINPLAVNRMPGGDSRLDKIVLQQLTIPTADMTGIDLTDVREIRIKAAIGADGTGNGGVYLSDLAFDTPSLGTAVVQTRTTVNVAPTILEEGNAPGTGQVAVYLNRADSKPITGYVSVLGSTSGSVGVAMQPVTFAPGEVCKAVDVPTQGNSTTSTAASSVYTVSVTNTSNAVMGAGAFANLTIREDDGVTGGATALPEVGVQGDPCEEALGKDKKLTASTSKPKRGDTVTVTGSGFRAGESVSLEMHSEPVALGSVVSTDGTVSFTVTIPADAEFGSHTFVATGYGSGTVGTTAFAVVDPSAPTGGGSGSGSGGSGSGSGGGTAAPAGDGSLAGTGVNAGQVIGWVAFSVMLLAGGGLLLVLRGMRRRVDADQ
ncbi:hypothetical protein [Homoserinibacter sp. GY 40078]|uniref:hypothetical protein n=1 Tax=Homoserinibacter sp. GY 40078 TaxID=2603275 RepID=UPI0011C8A94F|nr:hypothetical protein [Homoserinibacter sp. GY 40078]TXK18456.1 hypothetical protein FVQ89_00365 [Homoserinibacter sp. GY 40078]